MNQIFFGRKDFGMDAISPLCCSGTASRGTRETGITESTAVAATNRQTLSLSFTTAEGDTVTISTTSSCVTAAASYKGAGSAQVSTGARTDEFSLSIDGNLNREEMKDIVKAIRAYGKALKDTLNGRMQRAEAHLKELGRLDEIASSSATVTMQQAFSAQMQSLDRADAA
jgi:hypothetical protein